MGYIILRISVPYSTVTKLKSELHEMTFEFHILCLLCVFRIARPQTLRSTITIIPDGLGKSKLITNVGVLIQFNLRKISEKEHISLLHWPIKGQSSFDCSKRKSQPKHPLTILNGNYYTFSLAEHLHPTVLEYAGKEVIQTVFRPKFTIP